MLNLYIHKSHFSNDIPIIRSFYFRKEKFGYELFVIKQFITELYFNIPSIFFKQFFFYFYHLFDVS